MAGCAAGGPGGTHAAAGAIGCGAPEGAGSGRAPRFARGHPHLPCGCRCAPLSFTESSPRQSNRSGNLLLSRVSWTAILLHPDPRTPSALLFTGRYVMCRGNTFHHPRLTSVLVFTPQTHIWPCYSTGCNVKCLQPDGETRQSCRISHPRLSSALVSQAATSCAGETHSILSHLTPQTHLCAC